MTVYTRYLHPLIHLSNPLMHTTACLYAQDIKRFWNMLTCLSIYHFSGSLINQTPPVRQTYCMLHKKQHAKWPADGRGLVYKTTSQELQAAMPL